VCLLLVAISVFVAEGKPHSVQKRVGNLPLIPGDNDVSQLTALKPKLHKLEKKSQQGENGPLFEKHTFSEQKEKVVENGELKALLHHSNSIEEKSGDQPHNEDLTEIKVPELNIDTKVVDNDGVKTILQHKRDDGDVYGPVELAEYILKTGDQEMVVNFLQHQIDVGKMSEEEVLQYVDAIKEIVGEEENDSEGIMEEMSHVNAEPREESMILKMNEFLDNQVKEGKISEKLYTNLKDTLLETLLDDLKTQLEADPVYPGYE